MKSKQKMTALSARVEALEGVCLDLIARLERAEDALEEHAEDRAAAEKAERAFTDGVSSILNYAVTGRGKRG